MYNGVLFYFKKSLMNGALMTVLVLLGGLFAIISLLVYIKNRDIKRDGDKRTDK